jgi:peptidoglycan hydrolase-like protein with peptidoglycan-binding domain
MKWEDEFHWPKFGGGSSAGIRPKPAPVPEPTEHEYDPESQSPTENIPEPAQKKAKLLNPRWGKEKAYLDSNAEAIVDGDIPPEISHLTKVTFTLFATLPDGKSERIDAKDGHLQFGQAAVMFDLWTPKYRDNNGQLLKKADYYFLAKYREAEEVKSGTLPVVVRLVARNLTARFLKRGVRGEDVFGWQKFLVKVRGQPEFSESIENITLDGIFGLETRKATMAFQKKIGLEADGIVGPDTREEAELLGALFTEVHNPGKTEATLLAVRQGKIPVFPPPPPPLPPVPPANSMGSNREESWKRLRTEKWCETLKADLEKLKAVCQLVVDGTGDYIYDEYKVEVERMPTDTSPEKFLSALASNINGAVQNKDFDQINVFKRRQKGDAMVGEIVDIDILGPIDGSVVLGEMEKTYFIYQTIDLDWEIAHPENGSREFGYQIENQKIFFYTRGVSRPSNYLSALGGPIPQKMGWTALMKGISTKINSAGGKSDFATFSTTKERRDD